jgi:betaine-aldehyde dehydrogenase
MSAQFIDGRWVPSKSPDKLPVINPATEEVFSTIAAGSSGDVDAAVAAAREAFRGVWRNTTGKQRGLYLRAIARAIRADLVNLARMEVMDNGKPLPEAEWDISDAAACFEYYAGLAEELDGWQDEAIALPDDRFRCRLRYDPVGVAGQIIPWNYPLLMAAWKVAPALAAGCTVVLKPSEFTSLTAIELGRIAEQVELPAGVLNIITGVGGQVGAALSHHANVDKLAFTGSVPTGRAVMQAAAADIKGVSLELGGKSPFLVFADSDVAAAVEWIMFGIFWNQGQVCSATSRVLVEKPLYDRLLDYLVAAARKIPVGDGLAPGVKLGPLINSDQYKKVTGLIGEGQRDGARLVSGGGRPISLNRGYFLEPTIFDRIPETSRIWRDEIFGPVVCLRSFETEAEGIAIANDSTFGLAAAVMSGDEVRCHRVATKLEAGIVWENCSQPTFVEAPWGGVKKSGIGRELGRWGLENYLETKQVTTYTSSKSWGWYSQQ